MGAIYGFTGPRDDRLLARMGRTLTHRGPSIADEAAGPRASLAYRGRFDPAERGRRGAGLHTGPSQSGPQTIALAGMLTDWPDRKPGSPAPTPAELLAAYRRAGSELIGRLRGNFVLAIHDGSRLLLARDGAGARTIFYGRHAGRLLFAVEPKGVLAAPGFPRRLRAAALAQYLTFSFIPGSRTMLEDLYELPAGHLLTWEGNGEPRLERYFVPEEMTNRDGESPIDGATDGADGDDEAHWVERFRTTFANAVAERLPRDEPVAVFLSGGLDSSVVAAEVARQHAHPVHSYALHFGERYPHELEFARAVAARCGTRHEEILIRPRDFLPRLRQMVWHLDEPIGDPITMPNFELASRVAPRHRFAFNGEGGDPCFGGPKNLTMLLHHWYGGIERDDRFRERMYLASYRRGYEEVSRLLAPEWREQIDERRDLEDVLTPYFATPRPARLLDKLILINMRLKGAHLILPKVERMTAAWGLVPLAPLFDERLMRLALELPGRLRLAGGVEKIILKRAYANQLPPEVIARPKSGMRVPVHFWFQGELRRYARKLLAPRAVRRAGLFDPNRVKQLLDYNIEEGPGRYGLRLWMLLTLETWRRIVVEGEAV